MRKTLVLTVGALVLLAGTGFSATIKVGLAGQPLIFSAYCPMSISFRGSIAVSEPCTVLYRFALSNSKTPGPTLEMKFYQAGKQAVDLGPVPISTGYAGWVALEAVQKSTTLVPSIDSLFAQKGVKSQADFTAKCTPPPSLVWAKFYGVYPSPFGSEFNVVGERLGKLMPQTGGTLVVRMDGVPVPNNAYRNWEDTFIELMPEMLNLIPWDHVYQFDMHDGTKVVSNVISTRIPINIFRTSKESGAPGTSMAVYAFGAGTSLGTKQLKLGPYTITDFSSWVGGSASFFPITIAKCRVPAVPAGKYKVFFLRGDEIISNYVMFTVE